MATYCGSVESRYVGLSIVVQWKAVGIWLSTVVLLKADGVDLSTTVLLLKGR